MISAGRSLRMENGELQERFLMTKSVWCSYLTPVFKGIFFLNDFPRISNQTESGKPLPHLPLLPGGDLQHSEVFVESWFMSPGSLDLGGQPGALFQTDNLLVTRFYFVWKKQQKQKHQQQLCV